MLHLPQIAARWIKAHLAALHTDPGDPATTAADPATPAAEHAHRAGGRPWVSSTALRLPIRPFQQRELIALGKSIKFGSWSFYFFIYAEA